jgi:death-on-curing protein
MYGVHAALLSSAAARPFSTFDGVPLYTTPYQRAAALFHGIIRDHVFVDGNKRTATVGAFIYLSAIENQIAATPPSPLQVRLLGEVAIETALGNLTIEGIAYWLERILGPASSQ